MPTTPRASDDVIGAVLAANFALRAGAALDPARLIGPLVGATGRLAVYGSLRRTEENANVIADLGPPFARGGVRGVKPMRGRYPVLTWDEDGEPIFVEIYASPALTEARWAELDAFEGENYVRRLVPAHLDDGTCLVTSIYVDERTDF